MPRSQWFLAAVLLGASATAPAQTLLTDAPRGLPCPVSLTRWDSELEVHDAHVEWTSEQTFHNSSGTVLEGTYLFAVPAGAVAAGFELWMNGSPVPAEVLSEDRARQCYEDIVRRMRDPGLLEYAGKDLLRARIYPIPPGGDARIRTRLDFTAQRVGSLLSLDLPVHAATPLARLSFRLHVQSARSVGPVFSSSLDLDVVRKSEREVLASFEGARPQPGRVTFYYGVGGGEPSASLLAHRTGGDGHFLLTLFAPSRFVDRAIPRDVVFVLDRSGSMRGEKLAQAVAALQHGLATLHEEDRFEIVTFATEARALFGRLEDVSKDSLRAAADHLEGLRASGGTALADAVSLALCTPPGPGRMGVVVLLSDGEPTIGETDPGTIVQQARCLDTPGLRLFAFGLGHDVNAPLLEQLAEARRGATDYVLPEENLEVRVSSFFDRIAEPALKDVRLEWHGLRVEDAYPRELGDLFAGSVLHVLGRYAKPGAGTVVLHGTTPDGPFQRSFAVELPAYENEHGDVRPLYAARKVAYLLNQIRRNGRSAELEEEIRRLGRDYGIVTPYTSALVLEDESPLAAGEAWQRRQDGAGVPSLEAQLDHLVRTRTGRVAVETAKELNKMEAPSALPVPSSPDSGLLRSVAGKSFLLRDGVWVDTAVNGPEEGPRIRVTAYSPEYFELLQRVPELAPYLALGEQVVVFWDGRVYEVAAPASAPR